MRSASLRRITNRAVLLWKSYRVLILVDWIENDGPLMEVDVDVDVEQMYERRPQPLCPTLCTLSITFMYTS